MNPYLRLDFKIPKATYIYTEGLLQTPWPETEPISSTYPEFTAIAAEVPPPAGLKQKSHYPVAYALISIFLDGEELSPQQLGIGKPFVDLNG